MKNRNFVSNIYIFESCEREIWQHSWAYTICNYNIAGCLRASVLTASFLDYSQDAMGDVPDGYDDDSFDSWTEILWKCSSDPDIVHIIIGAETPHPLYFQKNWVLEQWTNTHRYSWWLGRTKTKTVLSNPRLSLLILRFYYYKAQTGSVQHIAWRCYFAWF